MGFLEDLDSLNEDDFTAGTTGTLDADPDELDFDFDMDIDEPKKKKGFWPKVRDTLGETPPVKAGRVVLETGKAFGRGAGMTLKDLAYKSRKNLEITQSDAYKNRKPGQLNFYNPSTRSMFGVSPQDKFKTQEEMRERGLSSPEDYNAILERNISERVLEGGDSFDAAAEAISMEQGPKQFPTGIQHYIEDAAIGMAEYGPSMAVMAIPGGQIIGMTMIYSQERGRKRTELQEKYPNMPQPLIDEFANMHAMLATPIESLGNLFQIRMAGKAFKAFAKKAKFGPALTDFLWAALPSGVGEGTEEGLQAYAEAFVDVSALFPNLSTRERLTKTREVWESPEFKHMRNEAIKTGTVGGLLMPVAGGGMRLTFNVAKWFRKKDMDKASGKTPVELEADGNGNMVPKKDTNKAKAMFADLDKQADQDDVVDKAWTFHGLDKTKRPDQERVAAEKKAIIDRQIDKGNITVEEAEKKFGKTMNRLPGEVRELEGDTKGQPQISVKKKATAEETMARFEATKLTMTDNLDTGMSQEQAEALAEKERANREATLKRDRIRNDKIQQKQKEEERVKKEEEKKQLEIKKQATEAAATAALTEDIRFERAMSTDEGVLDETSNVMAKLHQDDDTKGKDKSLANAHKVLVTGEDNIKKLTSTLYDLREDGELLSLDPRIPDLTEALDNQINERINELEQQERLEERAKLDDKEQAAQDKEAEKKKKEAETKKTKASQPAPKKKAAPKKKKAAPKKVQPKQPAKVAAKKVKATPTRKASGFTPAVIDPDSGAIFQGDFHATIADEAGLPQDDANNGFVDEDGKFYTRDEMNAATGVETSEDLEVAQAKETAQDRQFKRLEEQGKKDKAKQKKLDQSTKDLISSKAAGQVTDKSPIGESNMGTLVNKVMTNSKGVARMLSSVMDEHGRDTFQDWLSPAKIGARIVQKAVDAGQDMQSAKTDAKAVVAKYEKQYNTALELERAKAVKSAVKKTAAEKKLAEKAKPKKVVTKRRTKAVKTELQKKAEAAASLQKKDKPNLPTHPADLAVGDRVTYERTEQADAKSGTVHSIDNQKIVVVDSADGRSYQIDRGGHIKYQVQAVPRARLHKILQKAKIILGKHMNVKILNSTRDLREADMAMYDQVTEENMHGMIGGLFDGVDTVYLFADAHQTEASAKLAVWHEMGHMSLTDLLGADLNPLLDRVRSKYQGDIDTAIKQFGFEDTKENRLREAEEIIMERYTSGKDLTIKAKLTEAFRRLADRLGFNTKEDSAISDRDIGSLIREMHKNVTQRKGNEKTRARAKAIAAVPFSETIDDVGNGRLKFVLDKMKWQGPDLAKEEFGTLNNRMVKELKIFEILFGQSKFANMVPGKLVKNKRELDRGIEPIRLGEELFRVRDSGEMARLLDESVSIETLAKERGLKPEYMAEMLKAIRRPGNRPMSVGPKHLKAIAKAHGVKVSEIKAEQEFAEEINLFRRGGLYVEDTIGILSQNGKASASIDFLLATCQPTSPCKVCYAAKNMSRKINVQKAFRTTAQVLVDPKGFAKKVAKEINATPKTKLPFVRILGSGDLTTTEQITAINELAKLIDRPIHIFSRHHKNLAKLKGTATAPFVKMGSIDADLVEFYGEKYLSENMSKRGIANAFLFTNKSELPLMERLMQKKELPLILSSSEALHEEIKDEQMKLSSCPCDANERSYMESCKQCALSMQSCFMSYADKGWDSKGNIHTLGKVPKGTKITSWMKFLEGVKTKAGVTPVGQALTQTAQKIIAKNIGLAKLYRLQLVSGERTSIPIKDIRWPEDVLHTGDLVRVDAFIGNQEAIKELAKWGTFDLPGGEIQAAQRFIDGKKVEIEEGLSLKEQMAKARVTSKTSVAKQLQADIKKAKYSKRMGSRATLLKKHAQEGKGGLKIVKPEHMGSTAWILPDGTVINMTGTDTQHRFVAGEDLTKFGETTGIMRAGRLSGETFVDFDGRSPSFYQLETINRIKSFAQSGQHEITTDGLGFHTTFDSLLNAVNEEFGTKFKIDDFGIRVPTTIPGQWRAKVDGHNAGVYDTQEEAMAEATKRSGGKGNITVKYEEAKTIEGDEYQAPKKPKGRYQVTEKKMEKIRWNWWDKFVRGMQDNARALANLEKGKDVAPEDSGYIAHNMLSNTPAIIDAMLYTGTPVLSEGWIKTVPSDQGGLADVFQRLGDNADAFFKRLTAKSAQEMVDKGRTKLYGKNIDDQARIDQDLAETEDLFQENEELWTAEEARLKEINKAILDFAEQTSVISKKQRESWERDNYIPFYRIMEDWEEGMTTLFPKAGAGKIDTVHRLKGSDLNIADPFVNLINSYTSMINNSLKNLARGKTIELAEQAGLVEQVNPKERKLDKNSKNPSTIELRILGEAKYFRILDKPLYDTLVDLETMSKGTLSKTLNSTLGKIFLRGPKKLKTIGITIDPIFRLRNFIRDTLQTDFLDPNLVPLVPALKGFMNSLLKTKAFKEFESTGGAFTGAYHERDAAENQEASIKKIKKGLKKPAKLNPMNIGKIWRRIGEASENANRFRVFAARKKRGQSTIEAAYAAKDVLDFHKTGGWNILRFFTNTVPFLNARVQGLAKIGRTATDPKTAANFWLRGAIMSTLSLVQYAFIRDDERYKALPDWQKMLFWHFYDVPGVGHVMIPKPFEVGILFGSVPVAIAETATGDRTMGELYKFLETAVLDTFKVNPTSVAFFEPILTQLTGKDPFTGSPVVPRSEEGLIPELQYGPRTSTALKEVSKVIPISPRRMEKVMTDMFKWPVKATLNAVDQFIEWAGDHPERPTTRLGDRKITGIGGVVKGKDFQESYSKYSEPFYEYLNESNRIKKSVAKFRELDQHDKADELQDNNEVLFNMNQFLNEQAGRIRNSNKLIKQELRDKHSTGAEKRLMVDEQNKDRLEIFKEAVEMMREEEDYET